ncbi:MAG: hypothetical protein K0V04_33020 [Deltaproteobacteria bacterium]|nr:hypothetical protein [Deltaproteobacteria bacterium]
MTAPVEHHDDDPAWSHPDWHGIGHRPPSFTDEPLGRQLITMALIFFGFMAVGIVVITFGVVLIGAATP